MELAIGVLAGSLVTALGIMGLCIVGWGGASTDLRNLRKDHDRLRENYDHQKAENRSQRSQLNQFFALADELRGIDREDN